MNLDDFNLLIIEKGISRYECKKCQGIEVMGDFPHGSIWNLIKHKCHEGVDSTAEVAEHK